MKHSTNGTRGADGPRIFMGPGRETTRGPGGGREAGGVPRKQKDGRQTSRGPDRETSSPARTKALAFIAVALWGAVVLAAIQSGFFQPSPGQLPLNFFIGAVVPVAAFLGLYAVSASFRNMVLGWDLRLLTMFQAWRVIGFAMLALFAYELLPGVFAWPAGLGDVAVGLAAPYYAVRLMDRPESATDRGFVLWNWLGIFDFAVALGTGILASGAIPVITGAGATTAPMSEFPLALLPGFFVPLFFMAHLAALLQVRRLRARVLATA